MLDVSTIEAEIAVSMLDRWLEMRDGFRGSPAACKMHDLYGRMIYTDRGEYPTQEELDLTLEECARGLEWNAGRAEWQIDRALLGFWDSDR